MCIRDSPFAVGRKNWLFSNSVDGANANAVVYTMVEMAKAHSLNINEYLKFLLEHRPSKDMTMSLIHLSERRFAGLILESTGREKYSHV